MKSLPVFDNLKIVEKHKSVNESKKANKIQEVLKFIIR